MTEPRGLMATRDAMIWAQEFCRIFNGYVIMTDEVSDPGGLKSIDPGTMVGWFANAMAVQEQFDRAQIHTGTWHAFLHFYHQDQANASFHCSTVRYSPITFRLAEFIRSITTPATALPIPGTLEMVWDDKRINDVWQHQGQYEEDPGR